MEVFLQKAKKMAKVDVEPVVAKAPVKCSGRIAEITEKICKEEGIRYRIMPSGATHDGNAMASKVPVGMIFVPSKSGISHSKEEWTDWKDVYTGEVYEVKSYTYEEYEEDEDGEIPYFPDYEEKTLKEFRKGLDAIRKARVYAYRIDWLISGDDGEDNFQKRLEEDLKELEEI